MDRKRLAVLLGVPFVALLLLFTSLLAVVTSKGLPAGPVLENQAIVPYHVYDGAYSTLITPTDVSERVIVTASKGPFYIESVQVGFTNPIPVGEVYLNTLYVKTYWGNMTWVMPINAGTQAGWTSDLVPIAIAHSNSSVSRDPCGNPAIVIPSTTNAGAAQFSLIDTSLSGGWGGTGSIMNVFLVACGPSGTAVGLNPSAR